MKRIPFAVGMPRSDSAKVGLGGGLVTPLPLIREHRYSLCANLCEAPTTSADFARSRGELEALRPASTVAVPIMPRAVEVTAGSSTRAPSAPDC
jgi:hypothetical protein